MFPTPDISHLTASDYDSVYEPAEDSFLLMDALEQDIDRLTQVPPATCVEVGCGSGIVLTFLSQLLTHHAKNIKCQNGTNSDRVKRRNEGGIVPGLHQERIRTVPVSRPEGTHTVPVSALDTASPTVRTISSPPACFA